MDVGKGQDTHYTGDPLAVHTPSMETSVPGKKNQSRRSRFWVKFGGENMHTKPDQSRDKRDEPI